MLELEARLERGLGHLELLGARLGGREAVLELVARLRERPRERLLRMPRHPAEELGCRGDRADLRDRLRLRFGALGREPGEDVPDRGRDERAGRRDARRSARAPSSPASRARSVPIAMCSAPWYAASSPERSASTAGAIETSRDSSSRATGRSLDSRRPRTNTPRRASSRACAGSPSAASPPELRFICGSSRSASASRAGPRRIGFLIRDACRRLRADATSILPSSCRIAHAHECGPCTSTPFGSAIPPSRIFSLAIAPR